jgi:hypothetical protein
LPIKEATDGELLRPDQIYIMPLAPALIGFERFTDRKAPEKN